MTRRAGGARPLILGGHVAHDLSAENRHVTRRLDAESHAFAIARQHDDAYSVADQDGIAGFSSENQHDLPAQIDQRLHHLIDDADETRGALIGVLRLDDFDQLLIR